MGKIMRMLPAAVLASTLIAAAEGFAPAPVSIISRSHARVHDNAPSTSITRRASGGDASTAFFSAGSSSKNNVLRIRPAKKLRMSDSNNDGEGPGLVTAVFISGVLLFFVASAFAPLIDFMSTSPSARDLSLGDSVVTRQDGGDKLRSYQSKFDALSPARVQEKLGNLPVFYLSGDGEGMMGDSLYLSYSEAEDAAKSSSGATVKATTLDQVMYPLVLKRGSVKTNAKTPADVKNARAAVENTSSYRLVPSKAGLKDAREMTLKEGDIPLYVVERLAFASDDGRPQVPLFTERDDAITSYARLRESGGNKLPEDPTVRTTSLLDVLDSMERGTRPGVGQLEFYGNADDVLRADEMLPQ